ncbi:glycoside hydrolase family 10 protein [Jaapia argillacea MUCL 33604]|uniref:Beta-xylanase n=1 Tax=Jaapia argillacea MUCL 33604 TaxID=933084 RepID=A0A067PQN8_9AGAM|nr:glycoside hydrolase family 10 protein [Jaapia argillacea MUCL 33604]
MKLSASFAALLALIPFAAAQQAAYGQCGGQGWTGATTCVAGYVCTYSNAYYSQCLPSSTTSTSSHPGTTATSSSSHASSSSATGSSSAPASTSTAKLNTVAKLAGKKYFGTATDNSELTDTAYVAILDDNTEFGQLTPANSMKWDAIEPTQGTFTFTNGDTIANLAKANGQLLRGHNCVWYNQLPSWVTATTWTAAQLSSIVSTHCGTLVGHYKGQVYSWDVINEPFNDDGTWRTDIFYNTLGTSYVSIALQAARAADPNAKLYINDYNLESSSAKATAMVNLVKSLQAAGVPIDGVGIQGHLIVGEVPSTFQSTLSEFTALGIEVAITELDIRMTLPSTPALLAQQKTDYQTVIAACKAVSGCVGVTVWDYTDKYSWVPSTFSGQGAACPWDANLVRKPAYDGIALGWTT